VIIEMEPEMMNVFAATFHPDPECQGALKTSEMNQP
jgi:hypothetical protein